MHYKEQKDTGYKFDWWRTLSVIQWTTVIAFVVVLVLGLTSCKVQSFTQHHENDSIVTKTEYKWDSVYIDRYHTIFQKGDTIYKTDSIFIDRWHKAEKADTVYIDKTETIVQPQPYVPAYNKNCTRGFWVLLAILILIIGGWALRKYLKLKTGGLSSLLGK